MVFVMELLAIIGLIAIVYYFLAPFGKWLAQKEGRQARADQWFVRVGLGMLALGLLSVVTEVVWGIP